MEQVDALLIIEYVRTSIEILLQLRQDQQRRESLTTLRQDEDDEKVLFKGGTPVDTMRLFHSLEEKGARNNRRLEGVANTVQEVAKGLSDSGNSDGYEQ